MNTKHWLILTIILAGLGVGAYYFQEAKYNAMIDDIKEDLEEQKTVALDKKQKQIQERDQIIDTLKQQNEKAKKDSQYWYSVAKKRSRNPDYNIDFMDAANEIAKSRYKPGQ